MLNKEDFVSMLAADLVFADVEAFDFASELRLSSQYKPHTANKMTSTLSDHFFTCHLSIYIVSENLFIAAEQKFQFLIDERMAEPLKLVLVDE